MLRHIEETRETLSNLNYGLMDTVDVLTILMTALGRDDTYPEVYGTIEVVVERLNKLFDSLYGVQLELYGEDKKLESILKELEAPELEEPMKLLNDDGKEKVIEYIETLSGIEKYTARI